MTFLEVSVQKESQLKHAIIEDHIIERDGSKMVRWHHYLTCEKCRLRHELGLPQEDVDDKGKLIQRDGA